MKKRVDPISRRSFVQQIGVTGVAVAGGVTGLSVLVPNQRAEAQRVSSFRNPDPEHIRATRTGFLVRPNGVDDHDNLEWALMNANPGAIVRLISGTYKLGRQVVVPNFDGTLVGADAGQTTITSTDELNLELWEAPGGGRDQGRPKPPPFPRTAVDGAPSKPPPGYFLFYKTPLVPGEHPEDRASRIQVKNIRCRATSYAAPWMFGDELLFLQIINSFDWNDPERAPDTTRQDVLISDVFLDGYSSPIYGPFENGCSCVTVLGGPVLTSNYDLKGEARDRDAFGTENGGLLSVTPAEGDVTIYRSRFKNCRNGPSVIGYKDGRITFERIETDGCRSNCVHVYDLSNCEVVFRHNDLRSDPFLLPGPTGSEPSDVPSSLGCVVAIQGIFASLGFPLHIRFVELALSEAADPKGTWRPQGPNGAPEPSTFVIESSACDCNETTNTYCLHLVDAANEAFGLQTLIADEIRRNSCSKSQTCISLEHIHGAEVRKNRCSSQSVGVELYNSFGIDVEENEFTFRDEHPCEIKDLALGDKLPFGDKWDLSRVVPGAGSCRNQE